VIILAEVEHAGRQANTERDSLLYVGCSRARNPLLAVLSDQASAELQRASVA
jgi:hypothetical protein